MKPTPNQITECTDERQLCEWAAVYCMGWRTDSETYGYIKDNPSPDAPEWILPEQYQPTSPTERGKAQCWDLAVKYELNLEFNEGCFVSKDYHCTDKYGSYSYHKELCAEDNPQIAVVKAAIIAAIGE